MVQQSTMETYHVGADSTVNVSETDDHGQGDTTLVRSFHIVGYPSDGIWNVRVDTTSCEEHTNVGQRGVPRGNEDDVTCSAYAAVEAVRNNDRDKS